MVHIYNGILFGHRKEWNNAFAATRMDLEIIILSEVSQTEKDKYYMIITYMWNIKNNINEFIHKTETDSET